MVDYITVVELRCTTASSVDQLCLSEAMVDSSD